MWKEHFHLCADFICQICNRLSIIGFLIAPRCLWNKDRQRTSQLAHTLPFIYFWYVIMHVLRNNVLQCAPRQVLATNSLAGKFICISVLAAIFYSKFLPCIAAVKDFCCWICITTGDSRHLYLSLLSQSSSCLTWSVQRNGFCFCVS